MKQNILDWSNFTGVPDAGHILQLKADGWVSVILGTQFPDITRAQYAACFDADFPVESLYVFVYWDTGDVTRLAQAKVLADDFNLKVWLDCEWTKTGFPGVGWAPSPDQLVALIHKYKDMLDVRYLGIYTGRWWWPAYTNDNEDFSGDPLWHADYIGPPNFDNFIPYGGWTRPTIIQFSSNGVDGVVSDLDVEEEPDIVMKQGLVNEDDGFQYHYNDGVPIRRYGSVTDPTKKGRVAWNFGDNWLWERHISDDGTWTAVGYLSDVEGD